jgi:hypothetical protein
MKVTEFKIDDTERQETKPFLIVLPKGCSCGCSEPRGISISNGKYGLKANFDEQEWAILKNAIMHSKNFKETQ